MSQAVVIQVNGESRETSSSTLAHLLEEIDLSEKQIAVEHNKAIVRREAYALTALSDGDVIEIVHFIGGG